jgi:cytochrome oxidase Cu insertion factor (SCO1/SenC/PrrC family)
MTARGSAILAAALAAAAGLAAAPETSPPAATTPATPSAQAPAAKAPESQPAVAKEPEPGDVAPAFSLQGSDGKTYTLADFKGKQAVVVAWFPKAFTGG